MSAGDEFYVKLYLLWPHILNLFVCYWNLGACNHHVAPPFGSDVSQFCLFDILIFGRSF